MATIVRVPLEDLRLDQNNARRHTQRGNLALKTSLEMYGAARSVVVDGDNVVRAGNGTLEQAREAGIREAVVVDVDGSELVVVRRADWDETQARGYSLADNRTGDLSEFDWQRVAGEVRHLEAAGVDLAPLGWAPYELEPLRAATWVPPSPRGDLGGVDTTPVTPPIRINAAQRAVFERVAAAVRSSAAGLSEASEGEVLVRLCELFEASHR